MLLKTKWLNEICSGLLLLGVAGCTHAADMNLLQNASFEQKMNDGLPSWSSQVWHGEDDVRLEESSSGHDGSNCISIASDGGADAAWKTTVQVEKGGWYRLSGWIRTENVRGAVGALLNIQNTRIQTPAVYGTRDWTYVSKVFEAPANEVTILCLFGGWGASVGQAWYDEVSLGPVNESEVPHGEVGAVVRIDPTAPAIPYDPMIFGGFLEHFDHQVYGGIYDPESPLADEKGFRRDVIQALKELKVPVVRWPGGCFVSGYHWEYGVGEDRQPTDDMAWGVVEPNTFGTDEYVELCRVMGWEPYICNNAGNGTIEEMRNWVEYCNGSDGAYAKLRKENGYSEPRNVPIWSIGNENYHPTEIGYKPIETWAPFVRDAAKEMKSVDPSIKLTAAAQATREWTLPLLKEAGPYLDYISIHSYWLHLWENNKMPDYLTCIMYSEGPEETISDYVRILDEAGYRGKIKIAYDEWNLRSWHHPKFPRLTVQDYSDPEVQRLIKAREKNEIPSQYTMADALFTASFFNACLRHADDVAMSNIAPIINTRGPLYVYPGGVVKRTHFHAMALFANELEPRVGQLDLLASNLTYGNRSVPVADAVATVDESGKKWAVTLINRDPDLPLKCRVLFGDSPLDGSFEALVLGADSAEAFNDIEHPNRVAPKEVTLTAEQGLVTLPPHSLTILNVERF